MCLGVPGQIITRWRADDGALLADADLPGEVRTRLGCVPHLEVGDVTIVHADYALDQGQRGRGQQDRGHDARRGAARRGTPPPGLALANHRKAEAKPSL